MTSLDRVMSLCTACIGCEYCLELHWRVNGFRRLVDGLPSVDTAR